MFRLSPVYHAATLMALALLLQTRAFAQPLVCNSLVNVALDANCMDTLYAIELLDGGPYCCYDNYVVELDKTPGGTPCDGFWEGPVLYDFDIGMTYCYRVYDIVTGDLCYGFVQVTDNSPPTISCPTNQARTAAAGQCTYTAVGPEFDPLSLQDNCPNNLNTAWMLAGATSGNGTSTLAGVAFQAGTTLVTWTASDPAANTATCTFSVSVADPQPPTIACPGPLLRGTNPGVCSYTAVGAEFNPTVFSDNCPGASLAYTLSGVTAGSGATTLAGQIFQKGLTTVAWTVTDASNNTATCSFSVTIFDGQPPTITCPGTQNRNAGTGICTYTAVGAEFDPLSFGDNCPGATLAYSLSGVTTGTGATTLAGKIFQKGQTTVVWTATDAGLITSSCSFNVIVKDAQNPSISCPGAQNRNADAGICTYTAIGAEFDALSFGDNCPGASLAYTLSGATSGTGATTLASVVFQKGQTTVVWTVTDAGGNPASCSFVVTVVDNQGPGLGCPGAQNRNTNTGVCLYTAVGTEFNPAFFNDNCPGATIAYVLTGATTGSGANTLAGQIFQKGQTTVAWTVTDATNLTKTCSFMVTVSDAQAPSITCPGPQSRNTNPGVCSYTTVGVEFNPSLFGDNCPGAGIAYTLAGVTTGSGTATLAGTVLNKGVTMVNWTATDAANYTAVCAFSVTVNDAQPLTISCPGPQTRKTDNGVCTYTALGTEFDLLSVSSDHCPGVPAISYALSGATSGSGANTLAGKIFQKGQTTVTWTATDASGNPASCSFVVTVNDLQQPSVTWQSSFTRNTNSGQCTYTAVGAELDLLAYSDNCPGVMATYTLTGATTGSGASTLAGKVFNKGVTTVQWQVTDASNNSATAVSILTVNDLQFPNVACPANQQRNANAGVCTYTAVGAEFNPLSFSDNCPGATIAYTLAGATTGSGPTTLAGKVFNKGITTVKWTVTDANFGLSQFCTFTVDVKDAQGPIFVCPLNQTRSTNLNLCSYTAVGAEFNLFGIIDNCPGAISLAYVLTGATTGSGTATLAGKIFNKGITTVKWTAADASNNTASCAFTVDVKDTQPPKFTNCPPVAVYNINMTPGCTLIIPNLVNLANAAATDNCPGLTKTQAPTAGTVMTVTHNQNVPVVITAKDAAGNTATCNRIVKAKDVTPPTITTCPPNRTVTLSPDCKITVPDMRAEVVATDCSLPLTVTQNPAQGTVLPSDAGDVFNVVMTVTDAAGNAKTCTVVITAEFRYFAYIPLVNNTVKVVSTSSNTVVATVPGISTGPEGVAVFDKWIYVATKPDKVRVIDGTTNTLAATITVGNSPFGICVSPDGSRAYVTNVGSNTVSVVNTVTNMVIATIGLGTNAYPLGICISPDGSRVYAIRNNNGNVAVINTATNTVVANVGVGSFPMGACVSPDGSRVYVGNQASNNVSVINTTTHAVTTIPVGLHCRQPCVTPNGNFLYVTTQQGPIVVINTTTNAIVTTIPGLSGIGNGISVTPDGSRVYAQCFYCNDMIAISTATNTVVATISTGASYEAYGNFIGGPLCLFGNNLVGDTPETAYVEPDTLATDRALDHSAHWQVMPNPFTDALTVRFALEEPARVQVVLVDLTGRFIFLEKENEYEAGENRFAWNTEDLPEGAYLVGLKVEGQGWTYRKVMLMR